MLVEADDLVYDYDNDVVAAVGNVKIYYGGYTLQAEKVTYNRKSGRLVATDHVTHDRPDRRRLLFQLSRRHRGLRATASSSRCASTPRNSTYFVADNAVRERRRQDRLRKGRLHRLRTLQGPPGAAGRCGASRRPPSSPTRKRSASTSKARGWNSSGFRWRGSRTCRCPTRRFRGRPASLCPTWATASRVGMFLSVPYFWALAPNYDVTLSPTVYSRQGLLSDVEWRHTYGNLTYAVEAAGIYQLHPSDFPVGSKAQDRLARRDPYVRHLRFQQGLDARLDGNAAQRQGLRPRLRRLRRRHRSEVEYHLTGLRGRNYFNAEAAYYAILTDGHRRRPISPVAAGMGRADRRLPAHRR